MIVYFGDEVESALKEYIDTDRASILPVPGS